MTKLWIPLSVVLALVVLLFSFPFIFLKKSELLDVADFQPEKEACSFEISVKGVDKPIPLEEYVIGVVAAEMPATFHMEALKAQALAARTYALRATEKGKNPIAKDVSAQVYYTEAERKKNWGKTFSKKEQTIKEAVLATAGEVIFYEDELISAMFFSTSNGRTEDAKNFSGADIPYLKSVESLGEDKITPTYNQETELTLDEWNEALGVTWDASVFESLQLIRNSTGRVQRVEAVDGFEKDGRTVRELLNLRSTDFDIAYDLTNHLVLIGTTGYGHGVGMSQYGAEAFAQEGLTAYEIIGHYYQDTSIRKILNDDEECLKSP